MACTSPRTVSFDRHGRITYSSKARDPQYQPFLLPCGKCLACRLDYAKQWAIRCVHEASCYEHNCFITLTYSDEHLKSPKLVYSDWQNFMKKLRKTQDSPIGCYPKGEYGEIGKRPHWHAILFNWEPSDKRPIRTNHLGDQVFESPLLERLWGMGRTELGSVNIKSAGYCARYAAKKLIHGHDLAHDYHPIGRPSSKHAIGKKWLEKNYRDVFTHGKLHLLDGTTSTIPRYYERWFKETHPDEWLTYVTQKKTKIMEDAQAKAELEKSEWLKQLHARRDLGRTRPLTQLEIKKFIQEQKFKQLQEKLKL